jgi:hypothetical protein
MERRRLAISIGPQAGWHFRGQADLQIAYYCRAGEREGLYFIRKRLIGGRWEVDRWFRWYGEDQE